MNKKRLLTLAQFLETKEFPKGKFDLHTWMSGLGHVVGSGLSNTTVKAAWKRFKDEPDLNTKPAFKGTRNDLKPLECRTAGCALGWATTIPSFRRAGLRLEGSMTGSDAQTLPTYDGDGGMYAAVRFFDIELPIAEHLFHPMYYATERERTSPKAVAKRIRKLVASA